MSVVKTIPLVFFIASIIRLFGECALGLNSLQILPGCTDPQVTTQSLERMAQKKWDGLDRKTIKDLWPEELKEDPVTTTISDKDKIHRLSHQGRFTDWCECCSTFIFMQGAESSSEQLIGISIFYAATSINELPQIALGFLQAMGRSESEPIVSNNELNVTTEKIVKVVSWKIGNVGASREIHANVTIYRKQNMAILHIYVHQE